MKLRVVVIGSVIAATACAVASAQTITDLGNLSPFGLPVPTALSQNGSVVVGTAFNGTEFHAFRWTHAGGMEDLCVLPGLTASHANGVSADGTIIVGDEGSDQHGGGAFVWTAAGGIQPFVPASGVPPMFLASVSGDGATIIGTEGFQSKNPGDYWRAFRWSEPSGVQLLNGFGSSFSNTNAFRVNQDGSIIVGHYSGGNGTKVFHWTSAHGMIGLGTLPGETAEDPRFRQFAGTNGISTDGAVVVGWSGDWSTSTGFSYYRAFRWTEAGGMQNLGALPGDEFSSAAGANHDGSMVVGGSYPIYPGYDERPFLWTFASGMIDLRTHLITQGLDLEGWDLGHIVGISADGSALLGSGVLNHSNTVWLIHLAWPTDLNHDGSVNGADLAMLLGNWNQSGVGDLNGDGIVNGADLAVLLGAWTG